MSIRDFLALPPIVVTMDGKTYNLRPHVTENRTCSYRSDPIEFWQPSPHGEFRVAGRLSVRVVHSKTWARD